VSALAIPGYFEQPTLPHFVRPTEGISAEIQAGVLRKPPRSVAGVYWHDAEEARQEPLSAGIAKALEEIYVMEDRGSVIRFIAENRLRGLLVQARQPLNEAFGEEAVKILTLVQDDEDGSLALFCLVRVSGQLQEARQTLRKFDRDWWLAKSQQAAGILNFDFELA
jgi:hypothetical protein